MDFEITIIGAGVVGLAIGATLSKKYKGVVVTEKNNKFGMETSSRNSEVIHSGIYYPQNSLKALLCVKGRNLIYDYCNKKNVLYNKCGKYIVSTDKKEENKLKEILNNALKNGVENVRMLNNKELLITEPNVKSENALFFPDSGIIDSYGFMKSLENEIFNSGGQIVYESEVTAIDKIEKGYQLTVKENDSGFQFTSKVVINSAGLNSYKISSLLGLNKSEYEIHFWKGEYFSVGNGKNKLLKSLVYPVPNEQVSLGIHATLDLNGGLKLGPNAVYISSEKDINYKVDENHKIDFYESAKRFLPFLELKDLYTGQAGVRPKLSKDSKQFRDFVICNEKENGFVNFINLIGIESPGLTASLAIAEYVERLIIKN